MDLPQSLHIFRIPTGTIIERPVSALLIQSNASRDMRSDLVALLPRLRRFALTLAADVHGADALVRDVCGWAIANARLRSEDLGLDAWVFAAARRMASENARHKPARPTLNPAPGKDTGEACEAQALVAGMTPGLAGTFLLVEVEKFTYAEAADILGVSRQVLATHLCQARFRFAELGHIPAELRA